MKKLLVLLLFSLFIAPGNVAAADLTGHWAGTNYCSEDDPDYFDTTIEQEGDFFYFTISQSLDVCAGVLDGKKLNITCRHEGSVESHSFAFGEIKGNKLNIISYIPGENKVCKGTASRN